MNIECENGKNLEREENSKKQRRSKIDNMKDHKRLKQITKPLN